MAGAPISAISLFTGAGGFDLGLERCGFDIRACVEFDPIARATLQRNRPHWHLVDPGDVTALSAAELMEQADVRSGELDLLFGGPPCQPFSKSGNWVPGGIKRLDDPRASTLKAMLSLAGGLLPKVILIENVEGFGSGEKSVALKWIAGRLARINASAGTRYRIRTLMLDAVRFGVPQQRRRLFVVADREGRLMSEPAATHGADSDDGLESFVTAWDAIWDLDSENAPAELALRGKWAPLIHSIPEGQNYLWLTPEGGGTPLFGWRRRYWSFLLKLAKNRPAWTIQAQPGPSTGPFHWRNRMLSTRELARLQTFPDSIEFCGSERDLRRQIGNAVPPLLAQAIGIRMRGQLFGRTGTPRQLMKPVRAPIPCPPPEPTRRVPATYRRLDLDLDPHKGTGKGPRHTGQGRHANRSTAIHAEKRHNR